MGDERCMAVTGTAMSGPLYCGRPAKTEDANGRPICGIHRRGNVGIEWSDDPYRCYPSGTAGHWQFRHGPKQQGFGS